MKKIMWDLKICSTLLAKGLLINGKNPETRTTAVLKNVTKNLEQEIENIDNVMMKIHDDTFFKVQYPNYEVKDGLNQDLYNEIRLILADAYEKLNQLDEK